MKHYMNGLLIIASCLLSAFILSSDKPKAANNTWSYDTHTFQADTSYLSNRNKVQFDFETLYSTRKPTHNRYIGISFNKWPVPPGDYNIVRFVQHDSEVAVYASDLISHYASKTFNTGGLIHVAINKNGKHTFWANKVAMEVYAQNQHHWSGDQDSTFFSFSLAEY
jgi:hypothetical protein